MNIWCDETGFLMLKQSVDKRLYSRVGGGGIAPMGGAKRAPLILANIELCGSIWRSNDSLQHTKDMSTDEDVLI